MIENAHIHTHRPRFPAVSNRFLDGWNRDSPKSLRWLTKRDDNNTISVCLEKQICQEENGEPMQAYREIINSKKLTGVVNLPHGLKEAAEVELIVLPVQKSPEKRKGKKLSQNWAGALKEYRSQYTSLELQKKALEWR